LLMALKGAREWDKKRRPRAKRHKIVVPTTAHPAFDKAAHYFGLTIVHVPPRADGRADVKAMERAIDSDTMMLVGSAPQYPHGVVDPIEELAAIASRRGILMHVDACIGGFMLPFVRELGYSVPAFDLSVPGVTSLSVDLHKYGYAAKGASVLLYRDAELRKNMYFATADWPGGIYVSPTMTGTRPGGAIAAAWAIMHRLGHDGYLEIARKVMLAATELRDGVDAIDGLKVVGAPHMSIMAIASDTLDMYEVGDVLAESGWHLDRQQTPASLHLTVNHAHITSAQALLADLADAASRCQTPRRARLAKRVRDRAIRTLVGVIPAPITSRLMPIASRVLGVGGSDGVPERSAPMYGLMATLPNRGDLRAMVVDILSDMTQRDSDAPRILAARPVETRSAADVLSTDD
jgi:sphinganine-1-phosphate aldolase